MFDASLLLCLSLARPQLGPEGTGGSAGCSLVASACRLCVRCHWPLAASKQQAALSLWALETSDDQRVSRQARRPRCVLRAGVLAALARDLPPATG